MEIDKNSADKWNKFLLNKKQESFPAQGLVRIIKGKYPLLPKLPSSGHVLEVGCGDGRNVRFLRDFGYKVSAVEITSEIANSLSKRLPDVDVRVGTNSNLPFKSESFDLVVSWHAFYYLDGSEDLNIKKNMDEFQRVIKHNSKSAMVISVPTPENFVYEASKLIKSDNFVNYRRIQNDYFGTRNGGMLAEFKTKDSLCETLEVMGASEIQIGEELGEWFGLKYNWWVAVAIF